ncbi:actin-related protein 5 [Culicoides brevitarsis]|uniref:actin-related protein 5 n=1 Tax=Culicoides brevitarsis TaxID=469753 RepID=UPI00307BF6F8
MIELKGEKIVPDIVHEYTPKIRNGNIPIVIDNGSYQCRVGWACNKEPSLTFRNLIAKPRKERNKKDETGTANQPPVQIGNEIVNIEALRFQLKSQFDRNVVTHYQIQEQIFDYTFKHLGITTSGVAHPIVMTECFGNPNSCRALMSELLFECYGVPSVAYGVDGLFSYKFSNAARDGLIVNIGYNTTHVIPVLNHKVIGVNARRINIGGCHMINYLHRLLQLKYPVHVNAITISRVEELLHEHCSIAYDYMEELKKWSNLDYYEKYVKIIQLPYTVPVAAPVMSAEQKLEKKRELAKRLVEMNARKREEKLLEDEETLQKLILIRDMYFNKDEGDFEDALKQAEIASYEELEKQITQISNRIERVKQKMAQAESGNQTPEEKPIVVPQPPPNLSMEAWLTDIKRKRTLLMEKKAAKRQRKQDLAKRRTAAAQERMRIISQLAKKEKGTDDFGSRDEDWDIYKTISREGGDSDSELENEKLMEYEEVLRHHEPEMFESQITEGNAAELNQLHVGVEAIRAPELLFQPSMIGCQEAGLAEIIDFVLKMFSPEDQLKLANNVFLTGGASKFPGLRERLDRELLEMRPFETSHKITFAKSASMDGWYGAREFANNSKELKKALLTKAEYEEKGGEYFKEFFCSNQYFSTPIAQPPTE